MADHSKIEWTDKTWNPTVGCDRVSPGCDSCYAIRMAGRLQRLPAYAGTVAQVDGRLDWTGRVNTVAERLAEPLTWQKPSMVFVDSMSDLFHGAVPDRFIARVWAVMHQAPRHTFQVLTKRHARMRSLLGAPRFVELVQEAIDNLYDDPDDQLLREPWPPSNVWVGVSVEDQKWADIRIPALLETPASVRWVSAEPLLGRLDLTPGMTRSEHHGPWTHTEFGALCFCRAPVDTDEKCMAPGLDWVVVGGESGPDARPMHPDWARLLRDQCTATGVPFFFKQWGAWAPPYEFDSVGYDDVEMTERGLTIWPDGRLQHGAAGNALDGSELMWKVGKKRAGRALDGQVWSEYPRRAVTHV